MTDKSAVIVLVSGGMDSATVLADAIERFGNLSTYPVTVAYGQRHAKEREHALALIDYYQLRERWHELDLRNIMGVGGLTDTSLEIPHVTYAELGQGVSPTYVPFRNGLMLAACASYGSSKKFDAYSKVFVAYGAHKDDASNDAYPDCTVEFIEAMVAAIKIGTYGKVQVTAPFATMSKAEIVEVGMALDVPYPMTWSCYEGGDVHCGTCPTCRARKEAFEVADFIDPTVYAV